MHLVPKLPNSTIRTWARAVLLIGALALDLATQSCGGGSASDKSPTAPTIASQLVLTTSAAGAASGAAFSTQPVVAIRDVAGNTVSTATSAVTMSVGSGGGSVVGSATVAAAAGVATFSTVGLSGPAGTYTLTFTAAALAPASQSVVLGAGATSRLVSFSGIASGIAGVPLAVPPAVVATDASNNPVPGVVVTFTVTAGGGSLGGGTQTTNAAGLATLVSWTLGKVAGNNTLSVTAPGITGPTLVLTATGVAGPATQMARNAGSTTGSAGVAVAAPPSVMVKDVNGNATSGVAVSFAVGTGGGTLTGGSQTTNGSGIATAGSWTLGSGGGTNTLTATAPGLTGSPLTFTVLATVAGQQGTDRAPITNRRLAVFVIDFPDTPTAIKSAYFPTIAALRDTLFNGQLRAYLRDMSDGQFTITGDVFGYFTHQNPGWVNGAVTEYQAVTAISTITIPGFDPSRYDVAVFLPINDAGLAQGITVYSLPFQVNGIAYSMPSIFVPINIGYWTRDRQNYPDLTNSLGDYQTYSIRTGVATWLEGTTTMPLTRFGRTFAHELGHVLGLHLHANSRTNGASYDWEPEIPENNCRCYSTNPDPTNPLLGDLLNMDYGNFFDVMGLSTYGVSLNSVYRDYLGWTNQSNRLTLQNYGHYTVTLNPLNSSGIRMIEIRIPFQFNGFGGKNRGYFLEVRTASNRWDNMLANAQLSENNNGIMVLKTDGDNSQLLDMSPSANFRNSAEAGGGQFPDRRDVVLKSGMSYQNAAVRLSNVRKNSDGSFTVDVDILHP